MYLISSAIYEDMAKYLREEINSDSYYSGVVEFITTDTEGQEVECRIVASIFVSRKTVSMPECNSEVISNIIPVWFECHTYVETEEKINDFDLDELKNYLCVWE